MAPQSDRIFLSFRYSWCSGLTSKPHVQKIHACCVTLLNNIEDIYESTDFVKNPSPTYTFFPPLWSPVETLFSCSAEGVVLRRPTILSFSTALLSFAPYEQNPGPKRVPSKMDSDHLPWVTEPRNTESAHFRGRKNTSPDLGTWWDALESNNFPFRNRSVCYGKWPMCRWPTDNILWISINICCSIVF